MFGCNMGNVCFDEIYAAFTLYRNDVLPVYFPANNDINDVDVTLWKRPCLTKVIALLSHLTTLDTTLPT